MTGNDSFSGSFGTSDDDAPTQPTRRSVLKKAGAAGVATAWAVPAVQTLGMGSAAAEGSPEPPAGTGTLTGEVVDATTADPIAGALVSVDSGQSTTTGPDGTYTIPGVPAGSHSVTASATGYISSTQNTTVPDGGTATLNFALSPIGAGSSGIRAVLSWGEHPHDLDLHVSGPVAESTTGERFHCFWSNTTIDDDSGDAYCELDVDDLESYGPETQTVTISDSETNYVAGVYRIWVHNYTDRSGDGPDFDSSPATVNVYDLVTQRGSFEQSLAVGDDGLPIWLVAEFTIDDAGVMTTLTPIQQMTNGNSSTVF